MRGGTAKRLARFRPATGAVRGRGVTHAPHTVLPPWVRDERTQILAALPIDPTPGVERSPLAPWATWLGHAPRDPLPPLRLILVWDNLAGQQSGAIVDWVLPHGSMPRSTPLSGSWLNRAESVQRIIVGRALAGQHPHTAEELIQWREDTVVGWNAEPTPFVWRGKRQDRRQRARQRRLGGSAAVVAHPQLCAA